jgi:hypothetical protein
MQGGLSEQMRSYKGEAPRGGDTGGASGEDVLAAKQNSTRHSNCNRGLQLQCEACRKPFYKKAGTRRRFCSDACRMAAARAREARGGSKVECSVAFGNALNHPCNSKSYKPKSPDLYPSQFSVPIDLLGRGHHWPGAPKLDRKIWEAILRREGCAP